MLLLLYGEEQISERAGVAPSNTGKNAEKGAWGMPRLSEARKDATSCEKLRGWAHTRRSAGIRMGQPTSMKC